MKKLKERFYKILINNENFYIKQYYSNFHNEDKFLAIKELNDGIYCVLISDEKNAEIDYFEAAEYIKTLGKRFSLNLIVFVDEKDENINYSHDSNKLIINKDNFNVISCDEACMPLKHIFENVIQRNEKLSTKRKEKFTKDKMVTLVIIAINIIIFIITQIVIMKLTNNVRGNLGELSEQTINIITNSVFISFGAKYNVLIDQGEIWRLLTCAFLHSNLIHIMCNMYSLYIIGTEIEQIYGRKKYLIIYTISCITSSSLSYLMSPSISVGASGGIFGLMGALLAFAFIERHRINKKYISSLVQVIIINLFIGLSIKNIDNFAHLGGLIGGIAIGFIIYRGSPKKKN